MDIPVWVLFLFILIPAMGVACSAISRVSKREENPEDVGRIHKTINWTKDDKHDETK
jgi:Na+-transporting methylmalonyl-CoA/oxaloacetate decarboxylase gamma subunit